MEYYKSEFSELSDKKLLQLKRSLEYLINSSKYFFKNYYLDIAFGKDFKIIFSSNGLKIKIKSILKLFFPRLKKKRILNLR